MDYSVIIPTFNRPAELRRCVASIAAQDYPLERVEVIVVDDGGSVDLAAAVGEHAGRLSMRTIVQANAGPAAARNRGAREARGERVVFLDDDCEAPPDCLRALTQLFARDPACLAGAASVNALDRNACAELSQMVLDVVYRVYNRTPDRAFFVASYFMALPRELFLETGGFDEAFRTSEDREFCDRWLSAGRPIVLCREIEIRHHHNLSLRGLWRQHFHYGRGAWFYHRRRRQAGRGGLKVEGAFYRELLAAPFYEPRRRQAGRLLALLFLQQFANLAGYLHARWGRGATMKCPPSPGGFGEARAKDAK